MSRERVIYIPGVGKHNWGQKRLLPSFWRVHGLSTDFQKIDWTDNNYEKRLEEIGKKIERLGRVSLVGTSGGGKAVLSLFARHPDSIHRLVTVNAKANAYHVGRKMREDFPNLVSSSKILTADLNNIDHEMRKRILCINSLTDQTIPPEDAILPGAEQYTSPTNGHALSIVYALTIGSKTIADFIKRQ